MSAPTSSLSSLNLPHMEELKRASHRHTEALNTAYRVIAGLGVLLVCKDLAAHSITAKTCLRGISTIAFLALLGRTPPLSSARSHNPLNHAYRANACKDSLLIYHGNLPVLHHSQNSSHKDRGYAKGFMMAPQIHGMIEVLWKPFKQLPKGTIINEAKDRIPQRYLEEMTGVVDGYNAARQQWFIQGRELTLDMVVYFNLLPELGARESCKFECPSIIDSAFNIGPKEMHAVNSSLTEKCGKYGFLELGETQVGVRTVSYGLPLLVGCISVMNERGLAGVVKSAELADKTRNGLPALFYLRNLIETSDSVSQQENEQSFLNTIGVMGCVDLTLIDPKEAKSIQVGGSKTAHSWEQGKQLMGGSPKALGEMDRYYQSTVQIDPWYRLNECFKNPIVNEKNTVGLVYLDPAHRTYSLAFDNGYAANRCLMESPAREWLQRTYSGNPEVARLAASDRAD